MKNKSIQINEENIVYKVEPIINQNVEEKYIELDKMNSVFNNIKESNTMKDISQEKFLNFNKNQIEKFININDSDINSNNLSDNDSKDNRKNYKKNLLGKKRNNNRKKNGNCQKKLYSHFKKKNKIISQNNQNKKYERNFSKNLTYEEKKDNYFQIINIFPITEDKSKINHITKEKPTEKESYEKDKKNMSDIEELNSSWINYINEVISKGNANNENNDKEEEKRLSISLKIKDFLNFSFSNEKNIHDSENYIDVSSINKKEKYLPISNVKYNSSNELCKISTNSDKGMENNNLNDN